LHPTEAACYARLAPAAHGGALKRMRPLKKRSPPPGSGPGALAIPVGAPPPRLHAFSYDAEHLLEQDIPDVETLAQLRTEKRVLWVDVQGLGDERVLRRLGEIFELHPLLLADLVNVGQRPKVEDYDDVHLIVTRTVEVNGRDLDVEQVSIVLGPTFVLSIQERPGDPFDPVRERLRGGGVIRRMRADYLAYSLMDTVVDGYFPVLEHLGEDLERLEEDVIGDPGPHALERIHNARRRLVALRRTIWPLREELASLSRDDAGAFSRPVRVYVRDTYDHAVQAVDVVETYRELTGSLMDVYLSTMSQRTNDVMKVLTVVSTIFIPLTFIVGIYGMNFDYMPELRVWWAYPVVWAVMIAIGGGLYATFKARGWLE
jgi:magnesium transporter